MQINSLRGLLTEYGEVLGVGRTALDKGVVGVLEILSGRLPAILIDTLREQWKGLGTWAREGAPCQATSNPVIAHMRPNYLRAIRREKIVRVRRFQYIASAYPGPKIAISATTLKKRHCALRIR